MYAITQAAERVRKYLDQRALYRSLDQEAIAAINIGDDDEAWLTVADLRELVGSSAITPKEMSREEAAPATEFTYGQIWEAWHAVGADLKGLSWSDFIAALQGAAK